MHGRWVVLYALLTTACCCAGYPMSLRWKRSTALIGKAALRTLLKQAKILRYDPPQPTIYAKPGGYRRAVEDFRSLEPEKVQEWSFRTDTGSVLVNGKVGDRGIQLVKGDKDSPNSMINIFQVDKIDGKPKITDRVIIIYAETNKL